MVNSLKLHNARCTASMTSLWTWLVLVAMVSATTPHIPVVGAVDFYAYQFPEDDSQSSSPANNDDGDDQVVSLFKDLCPRPCDCYARPYPATGLKESLLTVNCSGRGLIEFPSPLSNKAQVLDMSQNKLQNLTSLPKLLDLQVLDISRNWMRHLDNQWVFEHASRLKVLSLADNALQSLQHGSFSGLSQLRELDLSQNIIKRIETHSFGGLNNLEVLRLEKNEMFQVKREWFLSMSSLISLYLGHNYVASLENNIFNTLSHLQHLDLSHNSLRDIPDLAFAGLTSLKLLNLSGNSNLRHVPSKAIPPTAALRIMLLDAIALSRLPPFGVSNMGVAELSVSFLPRLRVVEKSAFYNLTQLQTLQLHDNIHLVFLHPSAFSSLPSLRHLFLHNNGLIAVSSQILVSLPSLTDLHVHHNPLRCDCNIFWLRKELNRAYQQQHRAKYFISSESTVDSNTTADNSSMSSSTNTTTTTISSTAGGSNDTASIVFTFISEPDRVSCFFPAGKSSMPLVQLPLQYFSPTCPATTLPLFPAFINVSLGDELWLECQGLGVPIPAVTWILPGGLEINYTTSPQHMQTGESDNYAVEIVEETLLYLKTVTQSDSGSYGCRAVNSLGEDFSTTVVHVQNKPLTLTGVKVDNDHITVSWRGSIPRMQMSEFQLYYREIGSLGGELPQNDDDGQDKLGIYREDIDTDNYNVIFLHGFIHKCTISGLKPQTTYEVCLTYRQKHSVECHNYTTTQHVQVLRADGIVRVSKTQIGIGVASVLGVFVLAMTVVVVRKIRHRKDYQDPLAEEEKSSIPLEGLNITAPNTPLTSSRTALLPNSQI